MSISSPFGSPTVLHASGGPRQQRVPSTLVPSITSFHPPAGRRVRCPQRRPEARTRERQSPCATTRCHMSGDNRPGPSKPPWSRRPTSSDAPAPRPLAACAAGPALPDHSDPPAVDAGRHANAHDRVPVRLGRRGELMLHHPLEGAGQSDAPPTGSPRRSGAFPGSGP